MDLLCSSKLVSNREDGLRFASDDLALCEPPSDEALECECLAGLSSCRGECVAVSEFAVGVMLEDAMQDFDLPRIQRASENAIRPVDN